MALYKALASSALSAAVGLPVAVTFLDTVGYIAQVMGVSMQPTLNPERKTDYVFLNKWKVRHFDLERGEIVALLSPKNPDEKLIKRIVGFEGDVIRTKNKKRGIPIPKGHCWLEGDNTKHSHDSNDFGPVPVGLIYAKASRIVWPPHRWGKLTRDEFHEDRYIVKQNPKVTLFPNP